VCVGSFTCLILRRLYTHIGFDLFSPPIIYILYMALHSTHSIFDCSLRALSTNNSPIFLSMSSRLNISIPWLLLGQNGVLSSYVSSKLQSLDI
jgi:hypothetical protein